MFRGDFLSGLLTSGAALFAQSAAVPAPTPSVNPFERCDRNYVLPYNEPLQFKHRALDAPDLDLQSYRGNVVLLNFFATWCGPCNMEQPGVVNVAQKYYSQGLRVIGINEMESDERVRAYRDKYHIVYPIVMDQNAGLLARVENNDTVGPQTFPVSLFLSEDGMLTCYRRGAMQEDELTYKVERMLSFLHGGS